MLGYSRFARNSVVVFFFLLFLTLLSCGQAWAKSIYVSSASELEKALEDGDITHITIQHSITGNFVIPRWVESISGSTPDITITQDKSDKPVFEAESSAGKNAVRAAELWLFWPAALVHAAVSPWTADTLTIRDLTIEIYGSNSCGIDVSDLSKPVYIKNVNFVGKGNNVFSYRGGSNVHISK